MILNVTVALLLSLNSLKDCVFGLSSLNTVRWLCVTIYLLYFYTIKIIGNKKSRSHVQDV